MSRPRHIVRRPRSASARAQAGVAAVFFGIAVVALVTSVMLGFNVAQLYFAQSDLEREAGLAALAGAQVASGCRAGVGGLPGTNGIPSTLDGNSAAVNAAVASSIATNTGINPLPDGAAISFTAEIGRIDDSSGISLFVPLTSQRADIDAAGIDAVRVTLRRPRPLVIAAGLFTDAGGGTLTAAATAKQQATGTFSVGTTLAKVDLNQATLLNSLIPSLLGATGTSLSLNAVDYNGLAQAPISLASLMVAANVTDLKQLLDASISSRMGVQILSDALGNTVSGSVRNALLGLAGRTPAAGGNVLEDVLGQLGSDLNPTVTDALARLPFVNGLDLLMALAEDAAKGSTIKLPVSASLLGLASLNTYLTVIEPRQPGYGPVGAPTATAHTAQIHLDLQLSVLDSSNAVGGFLSSIVGNITSALLGLINTKATINLALHLEVADADATLQKVICPTSANAMPGAQIGVASNVATLTLGATESGKPLSIPNGADTLLSATVLGLPLLTAQISGPVGPVAVGSATQDTLTFASYNDPDPHDAQHGYAYSATMQPGVNPYDISSANLLSTAVSSALSGLTSHLLPLKLAGIPIPVAGLATTLNALLTPVLATLDTALIDPLLKSLGIRVGVATVEMGGVAIDAPVVKTFTRPTVPAIGG